MIGLILVTHGDLAREFLAATVHVVGPLERAVAICIGADEDMEVRRTDIAVAIEACDTGQGVIILTDMFGGTPSNLAISLLRPNVEVIAGVNLPMLIKLATVRKTMKLAAAVEAAQLAGRKYIAVASKMLGEAA
jgi:mannose PTS system EIIA component